MKYVYCNIQFYVLCCTMLIRVVIWLLLTLTLPAIFVISGNNSAFEFLTLQFLMISVSKVRTSMSLDYGGGAQSLHPTIIIWFVYIRSACSSTSCAAPPPQILVALHSSYLLPISVWRTQWVFCCGICNAGHYAQLQELDLICKITNMVCGFNDPGLKFKYMKFTGHECNWWRNTIIYYRKQLLPKIWLKEKNIVHNPYWCRIILNTFIPNVTSWLEIGFPWTAYMNIRKEEQ
jgi:hypothetical protein